MATRVDNANMTLAQRLGLTDWQRLSKVAHRPSIACIDWLFAPLVVDAPGGGDYLDHLFQNAPGLFDVGEVEARRLLTGWRDAMAEFVEDVALRAVASGASIVGCTSTFAQHMPGLALLRRIRSLDPSIVTLMGGANCEGVMGRRTHRTFDWVDCVVSGEAEDIIVPLCKAALSYGRDIPLGLLPDAVFIPAMRDHPETPAAAARAMVGDVRAIPLPDYRSFFEDLAALPFADQLRPGLPLESSRGCWWGAKSHCTFCGLNGGSMAFRAKPPETVLAEMQELARRHGIRHVEFVDNIFDTRFFDGLLPALEGEDYNVFFEFKSNLKREQVAALARAGIRWIQPGIENLDTRVLRLMRKGVIASRNVQLLVWARQFGVRLSWGVIWDFPGEDDEWYAEAAKLLPHLRHLQPGGMFPLRYDRFSPYHTDPASFGLSLAPAAAARLALGLPDEVLADLVYYFDRVDRPDWTGPGPGVCAFQAGMQAWREAWGGDTLPTCALLGGDGPPRVYDTRSGHAIIHRLSDVERAVLRAADTAPVLARIVNSLPMSGDGTSIAEIAAAVARLLELGLMLVIDDRAVALVLEAPVSRLLPPSSFPGGWIEPTTADPVEAETV